MLRNVWKSYCLTAIPFALGGLVFRNLDAITGFVPSECASWWKVVVATVLAFAWLPVMGCLFDVFWPKEDKQ